MKRKYVYLLVSNDKWELPCAVADTLKELSDITDIPFCSLWNSYRRKNSCHCRKYRVYKVDITDYDEYGFNFFDYLRYCKLYNLKDNQFSSLEQFKNFLFR